MRLTDLNWTLAPLCSFLYMLGGWGISKGIRRVGIPLAITVYAVLYYRAKVGFNWVVYIIQFALLFGVLTLPLTVFGDKMSNLNVAWAFVLGYLNVISLYPITQLRKVWYDDNAIRVRNWFLGSYVFALFYGFSILISYNWNGFEHKWTEMIAGLSIGLMAAMLIKKQ